jgi:predicted DNA binding protein
MDAGNSELLSVTVDVWHPDCWTLRATEEGGGSLLGHGMAVRPSGAAGRYEARGASHEAVETLVAAVRESNLTESVTPVASTATAAGSASGPATKELVVEFDPTPSIRKAFVAHGFVHCGPTRHEGTRERRSFLARSSRPAVREALEAIEATYDAEIGVRRITTATPPNPPDTHETPTDRLSPRQRDALELARTRGYYEYPRATTARALAAELGVSKTTFLEHLRKAEAELLGAIDLG